jgi:hypothetical protein
VPPQEAERAAVEALLRALEAHSPLPAPTAALQFVEGEWRLLYTTVRPRPPSLPFARYTAAAACFCAPALACVCACVRLPQGVLLRCRRARAARRGTHPSLTAPLHPRLPPPFQVTIRGSKRTKLGLRGMVSLGAFTQRIDVAAGRAINTVGFALAGGALLSGALTIDATFAVASPQRCALSRACGVRRCLPSCAPNDVT